MKLLIMPNSIKQIRELNNDIDGVIVGLKQLCINMPYEYNENEIDEIINLCNDNNKEVFISLNKNMFNSDIPYLKKILLKLENKKINGILYYDIAIVNMKEELNLKNDLVWNQEHLTTNYLTSDYWYEHGAKYTYLSSEITIDEINEICKFSKAKQMVTMFGYLPMFASRRHLVKNYLDTFNIKDNSIINKISKEDKIYQIIDDDNGTVAYSNKVLNGIKEIPTIKCDYIVLNSFNIDNDIFKKVVNLYKSVNSSNVNEYNNLINSYFACDTGFLYKETIYKVKKNG